MTGLRVVLAAAALTVLAALPAGAMEDKLVVVTSYPPDTTTTFKAAFETGRPVKNGDCGTAYRKIAL